MFGLTIKGAQKLNDLMTADRPARAMLRFAGPMLLGRLLMQGYTLVDGMIVGRVLGAHALAAIGAVTYVDWFVIGFGMALVQGFSIRISQAYGGRDRRVLAQTVRASFVLTLLAAVGLTLLTLPFLRPILRLMRTPEDILQEAHLYIAVIVAGMVLPMLTQMACQTMRALGDSKRAMLCMVASSVANIALDLFFVMVLRLGVLGSALGTLLSHVVIWPYLVHRLRAEGFLVRGQWNGVKTPQSMLAIAMPMALQNSIALVGVVVLQTVVNMLGTDMVAAYTVAMRFFFFSKEPGEALSHALSTFVAQNHGAGHAVRVRQGIRTGFWLLACIAMCIGIVTMTFAPYLTRLMLPDATVDAWQAAYSMLRLLAVMLPALYMMDGLRAAMQGQGRTIVPMISGAVELVARSVGALYLPIRMGFCGIGVAEISAWALAVVWMVLANGVYAWVRQRRRGGC